MKHQRLLKFALFLISGGILQQITLRASTPEHAKHLGFALPAFLVFLAMVVGMLSWGAFARKKVKHAFLSGTEEFLFDLSAGSVLLYMVSLLLTALGLFSSSMGFVLWIILASGFALGSDVIHPRQWFDFGKTGFSKFLMALVPLIVFVKLLEGLQFHQHGDAYITYLVGPRVWAESGSFEGFLRYSALFLSTSWESLYAWGTALMGFHGGAGLDISQWFSQWVSGGLGILGSLLVCLCLCQRLTQFFPFSSVWFPVIALCGVQVNALRWTQNLAKNDMGIVFWGMSAFYFSFYYLAYPSNGIAITPIIAFFAGAITGAAVVGKLTVAILGGLIALLILVKGRKNIGTFILGGLAGSLPIFVRNYLLTKNPVFPWMPNVFPSPVMNGFGQNGADSAMNKGFLISNLPLYLLELYQQIPWIFAIIVLGIISHNRKKIGEWVWIPLTSFAIFTVAFRSSTGVRYHNATLVLLSFISFFAAFAVLNQISERFLKLRKNWILAPMAVLWLAQSNLTFFTLFQIGNSKKFGIFSEVMAGTNEIGGPAKVWIRSNIPTHKSIISFGDVHIYYLVDYPLVEVGQSVEYGEKVFKASETETAEILKNAPFDYLYLAAEDYYKDEAFENDRKKINAVMQLTQSWDQSCKKFDNTKALVWDLKCLKH